jgi:hypothetical protein
MKPAKELFCKVCGWFWTKTLPCNCKGEENDEDCRR